MTSELFLVLNQTLALQPGFLWILRHDGDTRRRRRGTRRRDRWDDSEEEEEMEGAEGRKMEIVERGVNVNAPAVVS